MMHRILVIVPAYNEEASIVRVVHELSKGNDRWDILVVNDASTDRTGPLVSGTGTAVLIDLPLNLGVGGAIQTGFKYALLNEYEFALQFDGDGQHRAGEINKLLDPLISGEADVTIGSRFIEKRPGFKSTWSRRFGIKIFEWLSLILIRQRITDCTSGFRAYNKRTIRFLAENYPVDYPEPEAVILLGKHGFRMREVFTSMRERQGGSSSITFLNSPYYMTKVMLGMIMTAIR
jgi:glycosyltransferase involved in cell wall biosynthesis